MKIRSYLALAAAALVMANCSQEEALVQVNQPSKGFTATIEGTSRSTADPATGEFVWTAGDAISVYTESNSFDVYKNSEVDVNTFAPQGEDVGVPTGYAIYPAGEHSISGQDVTINLPATYAYGSTNAPMLATIEEGSSNLAFKHLAGMMRFVVKNVPAGASSFVFTTEAQILTGSYNVVDGQIRQNGEGVVNNNNSVTITFDVLQEAATEPMVFFVPLPVGTYGNYTVAIKGTNVDLSCDSEGVSNTIGRCTMLLMPEFTVEGDQLNKGAGSTIAIDAEEANLNGNQSVTIDASDVQDASATLVLKYTPKEGNATLNITDGSGKTESQDSEAKIEIVPDGAVESLNLNTPTLTVELGEGTYGTVEALTATQTLIIGDGVSIETLILNGGALQVAEGATIDEIIVKDADALQVAIAAGVDVQLGADITLSTYLRSTKDVTVNLNDHNITSGGLAFYVTGGTLTIDGEGIVTGNSGNSYSQPAVWAATNGKVVIKNGTYTVGSDANGNTNDCIYANGGEITINGGTFSNSGTYSTSAGGVVINAHNSTANSKVIVNGGTFNPATGCVAYEQADVDAGRVEWNINQ